MSDRENSAADVLNILPEHVRRNYFLNIALIRGDIALAFALVMFFITALHTSVALLLPIAAFIGTYMDVLIKTRFTPGSYLSPLPSDIKARIGEIIKVPKRTIFRRGPGHDCASVSLYFIHIILLPKGFENDLHSPNKRAVLLHELSHDKFFDYLAVLWIVFTSGLFLYGLFRLVAEYLGYTNPIESSWEIQPRNEHYSIIAPVTMLVILTIFNAIGIFHRKEHNADFGAYIQAPELYYSFLRNRITKSKYYKSNPFNIYSRFVGKLYHPTLDERLDFLIGQKTIEKQHFILPALIFGFCPGLILFSVAVGATTLVQYTTVASILSIPLGVVSIIFCGLFLKDVFENRSLTTFTEKCLIWFFMLVGSQLFMFAFIIPLITEFNTSTAGLLISDRQLSYELIRGCFSVFFAYLQFAIYLLCCSRFIRTFFVGPLALAIFVFTGYGVFHVVFSVEIINFIATVTFCALLFFIPLGMAMLFEYCARGLMYVFFSKVKKS